MATKRHFSSLLFSSCSVFALAAGLYTAGIETASAQYGGQPSVEVYLDALDKLRPEQPPAPPPSNIENIPQQPAYAPPASSYRTAPIYNPPTSLPPASLPPVVRTPSRPKAPVVKRIYAKPVFKPTPAPEAPGDVATIPPTTPVSEVTPLPAELPAPAIETKKEPEKAATPAAPVAPAVEAPKVEAPKVEAPAAPPAPSTLEDDTDKILSGQNIVTPKIPSVAPEEPKLPEIPEIPPAIKKETPALPPLPKAPTKPAASAAKPKPSTPAPQETSWYDKITGYFSGDDTEETVALPPPPAEPTPAPLPDLPVPKEEIQIPAELKEMPAAPAIPEAPVAPTAPATLPAELAPAPLTAAPALPAPTEVANNPAMPALPPGKAPKTPPVAEEKDLKVVTPAVPPAAPATPATPAEPAAPAAPAIPGLLHSVNFAPATKELSAGDQQKIVALAGPVKADKNKRLKIVSYATPENDDPSTARRLSLQRAIAVRKVLLDQGIDSMQLNVQAMGNAATSGNKDRVDVIMLGAN